MIALDTSASMAFPETSTTKFRYAQIVAAALSYLVSEQSHAVGLMTMEDGRFTYMPARGGRPHLRAVLARIDRLTPGGAWDGPRVIDRAAELLQRRGIVIAISDFYDAEDATRRELRRVAQRGHDVAMLQVLSAPELELPFVDHAEIEDLESGERRLFDAQTAGAYQLEMQAFLDRCRSEARRDGIDYALFSTATPPAAALRDYLLRRSHAGAAR
jgi:uncharacterized protein (DUF58 family)